MRWAGAEQSQVEQRAVGLVTFRSERGGGGGCFGGESGDCGGENVCGDGKDAVVWITN